MFIFFNIVIVLDLISAVIAVITANFGLAMIFVNVCCLLLYFKNRMKVVVWYVYNFRHRYYDGFHNSICISYAK